MNFEINGKLFSYVDDYKNDSNLRKSFNLLTEKVYGFDFENWFQNGYWTQNYIPYSLTHENKVVANVSVNTMNYELFGEHEFFIQIGTVMTEPEFRELGLSRILMNKVLETWKDQTGLIYLFANDNVLDFYPKFGFKKMNEYQYIRNILNNSTREQPSAERVNMESELNRKQFFSIVGNSKRISDFSMTENPGLIMFYSTGFMKDNIYFIPKLNTYVVAEYLDSSLTLYDYFSDVEVDLDEIINHMITSDTNKIILGFTPKNKTGFELTLLQIEDTTLFTLGEKSKLFTNNKLMFPLLSHA